jgi:uncharacterized protein YodC (DUF2158 family)
MFSPGDVVILKSGGPALTVLTADEDDAKCLYFSEELGEFKEVRIPIFALEDFESDEQESDEDEDDDAESAADDEADDEDEEIDDQDLKPMRRPG